MLVYELIFKHSDFIGIMQKKSTKNIECYCLLILIIFKTLRKYTFFVFICQLRLKLIYNHKNKVYSVFPSNFI
jgi:hypothetical protein